MKLKPLAMAALFCWAASCASFSFAAIYEEDFEDGIADQWLAKQPAQWAVKGKAEFNRVYRAKDPVFNGPMISMYTGAEFADFDFRVTLRNNNSAAPYVLFRATDDFYRSGSLATGSGYAFGISAECNGTLPSSFKLFKLTNGAYQALQDWTSSEHLKCDLKGNRLRIVAKGGLIKLFINTKLVFKYQDSAPLTSGRIGLLGYTLPGYPTEHRFDNIYVSTKDVAAADTENERVDSKQEMSNAAPLPFTNVESLE
jgi:hypothetical protein